MPKFSESADPPGAPRRVAPDDALPDVMERVVLKRQVHIEDGDVLLTRERVPRLNPYATLAQPFRYRVRVSPEPSGQTYTQFQHAAICAEDLATRRRARVLYIEADVLSVMADYRA